MRDIVRGALCRRSYEVANECAPVHVLRDKGSTRHLLIELIAHIACNSKATGPLERDERQEPSEEGEAEADENEVHHETREGRCPGLQTSLAGREARELGDFDALAKLLGRFV